MKSAVMEIVGGHFRPESVKGNSVRRMRPLQAMS